MSGNRREIAGEQKLLMRSRRRAGEMGEKVPARPGLPVSIVTGFLGAGKTTLLNHILHNRKGMRIACFVNELGAVGIDTKLLRLEQKVDDTIIVTLENGCICCTINKNLVASVEALLEQNEAPPFKCRKPQEERVECLVIETSGAADVGPIMESFQIEELCFRTHLDSVITVVDGSVFTIERCRESVAALSQIRDADMVVVNKTDLLDRPMDILEEEIHQLTQSPTTPILHAQHCKLPLDVLLGITKRSGESPPRKRRKTENVPNSSHLANDAFETLVFHADRPFDPILFEDFISDGIPKGVIRGKGVLWLKGVRRSVIFQLSGRRTNPFETVSSDIAPKESDLVLIGFGLDKQAITTSLTNCLVKS